MELRQIRYFIAVAEELNFTRAAERCHIAQPPLSQQIKKLEEELGVKLFDRTNRSVSLTKEGETFLPSARTVMSTLEAGVEQVRMVSRGEVGLLRVGFLSSAIQSRFPEAVTAFRARFPGIVLDMREMQSLDQNKGLHADELDVALCHHCYADDEGLKSSVFLRDNYFLAVHRDHPLASRGAAGWKDLDGESFIMFSHHLYPVSFKRSLDRFKTFGINPRIVQEAKTHGTKLALVAAGMGVGFVPERMRAVCPEHVRLISFKWDGVKHHSDLKFAWRKGPKSTALTRFLEVMNEFSQKAKDGTPVKPDPTVSWGCPEPGGAVPDFLLPKDKTDNS